MHKQLYREINETKNKTSERINKDVSVRTLQIGDTIFIKNRENARYKNQPPFIGPFVIIEALPHNKYKYKDRNKLKIVHRSEIRVPAT